MTQRSGVLSVGPGFCWQVYGMRDATGAIVEGAACYLERRADGLRGLLRHDARGWWVASFSGQRVDVPAHVVDSVRGTAPHGSFLLLEQAELRMSAADQRFIRGFPSRVQCPDCGVMVVVA